MHFSDEISSKVLRQLLPQHLAKYQVIIASYIIDHFEPK